MTPGLCWLRLKPSPSVSTDASMRCRTRKPSSSPAWQDYGTGRETPCKSSAERELAHTSAEAQPGSRLRHPRGNSGDIGRTNRGSSESRGELARAMPSRDRGRRSQRRQRRKWFSRKYYASVMNIKEFYEDNIGKSFTGILSDFARRKK